MVTVVIIMDSEHALTLRHQLHFPRSTNITLIEEALGKQEIIMIKQSH